MSILMEDFERLQIECERRKYDCSRMLQLAAAIRVMKVKYKHDKHGHRMSYLTVYKSKKVHHPHNKRYRDNF